MAVMHEIEIAIYKGKKIFTSRLYRFALPTRSVFSSTIHVHHAYVVHIQENVILYSHSAWPLTSRLQAVFPPTHPWQSAITIFFLFFLPVVRRWSDSFLRL